MELQGLNTIDEIINDFVAWFGYTAEFSTDFSCVPEQDTIFYCFTMPEKGTQRFMASVEELQPSVSADPFLWSLLHEIGHLETWEEMSDNEVIISNYLREGIEEGRLPEDIYYEIPEEKAATRWAVEYAEAHIDELSTLWSRLQPAIMEFYKLNNVEEE